MRRLLTYLRPRLEQEDPRFREELQGLSVIGLRIIVWMSVGANIVAYALMLLWLPAVPKTIVVGDLVGLATITVALCLSYWSKARPYARLAGVLLLVVAAVAQMVGTSASSLTTDEAFDPRFMMPTMMAITMMLALVCLPLKPVHTLALGGSITAASHWMLFGRVRLVDQDFADAVPFLVLIIVTLTSVALSAVVYHQRASGYTARRNAQRALEELQHTQRRLLVSETASSQNRFAAALCHDLNTPLGALSSSLSTLVSAHESRCEDPELAPRLDKAFDDAADAGRQSLERMNETLGRMKRITNLDRSEERDVDLNELWRDTLSLLASELSDKAELKLDLSSIPSVKCRPQQLSAVFANLVTNAAAAVNGSGTIAVSGARVDDEVVFEVADDGAGMSEERLAKLFDPGFKNEDGRVRASWSMFVSRGILTEHGGHIEVESELGRGTIARVFLPLG